MRHSLKIFAAASLPLGLAACNHDSSTTPATSTQTAASFQSKFGTTFAADYNADPNSAPPHPTTADVPAISLSTEPLDN